MVATPFHCSSGSALGLETSAPSISPAARRPMGGRLAPRPSCPPSTSGPPLAGKESTTAGRPSAGGPPLIFQYVSEESERTWAGCTSASSPLTPAEGGHNAS